MSREGAGGGTAAMGQRALKRYEYDDGYDDYDDCDGDGDSSMVMRRTYQRYRWYQPRGARGRNAKIRLSGMYSTSSVMSSTYLE